MLYLFVEFGVNPSHTHGDGPPHGHVHDLGQHGGVALQDKITVVDGHSCVRILNIKSIKTRSGPKRVAADILG